MVERKGDRVPKTGEREPAAGGEKAPSSEGRPRETPSCCTKCGEPALVLLGETRHSLVRRCEACGEIQLLPRK